MSSVILTLIIQYNVLAGLIMTQGQTYDFHFTSIDATIPFIMDPYFYAELSLGDTGLEPGEAVKFTAYENGFNDPMIGSVTYSNNYPSLPVPMILGLYSGDIESVPWQDQEGSFRIEILSGTVELESFTANTIINGDSFSQTYAIPEPSSIAMILTGTGLLYLRKKYLPTRA